MSLELAHKMMKRKLHGNYRSLKNSNNLIDFASNDYLGLASSQTFAASVIQEWEQHRGTYSGFGSTGSRLLEGNRTYTERLEEFIAQFHGFQSSLLFTCGYMANVGLMSTVAGTNDYIFYDTQVHASTREGIRLSKAYTFPFKHNNMSHLEDRIKNCSSPRDIFICVESIYSTDGSQAPLKELIEISHKYNARLIVDEAHAVGILGPEGKGLVAEHNLSEHIYAQVITFGKALGTHGAAVLGSHQLIDSLINFAKPFIYTTAAPLITLAAITCSYKYFPKMIAERVHVKKLIKMCSDILHSPSQTHIQSILIPGNQRLLKTVKELRESGFSIGGLTSPTVPKESEMLRISLHSFNTTSQLETLLEAIKGHIL